MQKLRKMGVKGRLGQWFEAVYADTVNKMRMAGEMANGFSYIKVVRQCCPLSPLLFSLYILCFSGKIAVEWAPPSTCLLVFRGFGYLISKLELHSES